MLSPTARARRRLATAALAAGLALTGVGIVPDRPATASYDTADARLVGWSTLPARTYVPEPESPPSGHWIDGGPFPGQPVQGFSGADVAPDGTLLVLSDNGYGNRWNSPDFLLAVHRIRAGTSGRAAYVRLEFNISDPRDLVPWPIWSEVCGPADEDDVGDYTCPSPGDRTLTGYDFDPESMAVARDGSYWFGDEFGPYLLHTNARGELIEPPIKTPGVVSPNRPEDDAPAATIPNSGGYEGLGVSPDGRRVYAMLEKAMNGESRRTLRIYVYDTVTGSFAARPLRYRAEGDYGIGDLAMVSGRQALVTERADRKVYLFDLADRDGDGFVDRKTPVVSLRSLPNPRRIAGQPDPAKVPYDQIEALAVADARTLVAMIDNDFPDGPSHVGEIDSIIVRARISEPLNLAGAPVPRISLRIRDTTLRAGQQLVARGQVRPPRPGATVQLLRRTAAGPQRLARTRLDADGRYRFAKVLRREGRYAVYVRLRASAAGPAGTSPVRVIRVR